MQVGSWDYAAVFAVTAALTLLATPLALRYAVRRQILDHPGAIKAQASPVPYLGGAAIVLAFATVVLMAAVIRPPNSGIGELAAVLGLGVLLALIGLLDDLHGLSPWFRLAVEIAAGVAVWATPAGAELTGNQLVDAVVTVCWVVGVTNAFNLLDNMDGLSAGVAAVASTFVFVMAARNGQFLVATLAIGLAGCALGFLRSNFHPARIYMGDAGALFLGFMLAVLGLKLRFEDGPRSIAFAVPIVVLGVPLFDTVLVTINRLRHRRSPFSGGRDHASHRLVFIGIPVPAAVMLIYLVAASLGCLGLVLSRVDRTTGLILLGWITTVAALLGVLLSLVPVYATSRRRHVMLQEVRRHDADGEGVIVDDDCDADGVA
jgi:UDP-GlcNAc:undecaprenyl-phosphate GlcNAc-1-phosphate transferase